MLQKQTNSRPPSVPDRSSATTKGRSRIPGKVIPHRPTSTRKGLGWHGTGWCPIPCNRCNRDTWRCFSGPCASEIFTILRWPGMHRLPKSHTQTWILLMGRRLRDLGEISRDHRWPMQPRRTSPSQWSSLKSREPSYAAIWRSPWRERRSNIDRAFLTMVFYGALWRCRIVVMW